MPGIIKIFRFFALSSMHLFSSFFTKYKVGISLYSTLFLLFFAASNINWGGKNWEDILEADAKGYYAYLPAVFIYQDLNFGFLEEIEREKYPNKNLYYDYRHSSKGRTFNKYFCGTALAELPFFLCAHAYTLLSGGDADGYSKPYLIAVNIGALVWLWIALLFCIKILRLFSISDSLISFLIPVIVFASNLFVYTVMDPGMSHVYSMALFSIFIYHAMLYFRDNKAVQIPLLFFILAFIILIRPSNALIVLSLPFMAGSFAALKQGIFTLFKNPFSMCTGILLFLSVLSLQLLAYKSATGDLFVYSYNKERFYFNDPHILDILFSYRRGFFLYSPVFLISLFGFYTLYKTNPFRALTLFIFLFIVVYTLSCWWIWWYGGGFSCRVFVEFIPFLTVLLAVYLQSLKRSSLRIFSMVLIVLICICQIQIYQYRHYVIHWENTDKAMYWENFLRIDKLL